MTVPPYRYSAAQGQLGLCFGNTESSLKDYLEERLQRSITLVLTENSTAMLSARVRHGVLSIRLHRMFLSADNRVIDEIVSFLKNRRGRLACFRSFVRCNREQLDKKPPKRILLRARGKFHDLSELFREINEEYFSGMVEAAITWGTRSPRHSVRKRTLGSYSGRTNTIRINPVLDRKTIPRYFVAFVVYHEMLHAAMGTPITGARRSIHSREFRKRERLFKNYDRAMAWERGGGSADTTRGRVGFS
jgi:hypothetical protein